MAEKSADAAKAPESEVIEVATKPKFDWTSLNTLAVVSLASAISGIGSLIAIITGHIALAQIKKSHENGRTMAIIGTSLGYASIAVWVLMFIGGAILRIGYGMDYGNMQFGGDFREGFGHMRFGDND
ncbi:MAG: DUF4190 domain-containing protein [Aquiluna sp.]|nr:DUF4190 domain-containing protein [Aquiluna sp.]MCF8545891.1 DUF4190 domain-containing protein [Aquiluna sp.]